MFLSDLLAGFRRRWYVVLVGLLATVGLCLMALRLIPAEYVAKASVLLLPPNSTVGTGGNPYLSLGGLQGAADVLARSMTDATVVEKITPAGSKGVYTFEPDATTSAPMLVIESRDVTPDGALRIMGSLIDIAPATLAELQTKIGAPEKSLIRLGVITRDVEPLADRKSQLRALIVAAVGGLGLTLLLTSLIDSFLRRRAGRSATVPAADDGSGNVTVRSARSRSTDPQPTAADVKAVAPPATSPAAKPGTPVDQPVHRRRAYDRPADSADTAADGAESVSSRSPAHRT